MKTWIVSISLVSWLVVGCEQMLIGPAPENTSKSNFETIWKTLDENYALFVPKKINWDSLHVVYASRITTSTSESELWDICGDMLSHLNDGHVVLLNQNASKVVSASKVTLATANDFSLDLVKSRYLTSTMTTGVGYLTYGKIAGKNIGYVHISSFTSPSVGNDPDWAFDIDDVVKELQTCDAMVVDVRNNGGGLRVNGDIIVSAFIDRDITYFRTCYKTGPGHNDFGKPIPVSVSPRAGAPCFTKKIAFLTNRLSASGSEYAAQVFKNLPYSTQIGDTTHGSLGEITNNAQLPNGWLYWYPCSLTLLPDGTCPEGRGILPDILVKNTKADLNAGYDRVLETAISHLTK